MAIAKQLSQYITNYRFGHSGNFAKVISMRKNLSGLELLRNMGKAMAPIFIALWLCGIILFLTLKSIPFPDARTPSIPDFTFENVGPCLGSSQKTVERFKEGDQQYICADMKTNESTVYLELHVFTSDKKKQVYVRGVAFTSGPISYIIYPPLPPGKYWAYISWARPALVDFEFEVVEK